MRARVRGRSRARAARLGGRRRRDGGRGVARPHVPGGGSDRRADPGRAGAGDGGRRFRSDRSFSAAAAARTWARSRRLSARFDRLALVWLDAHGDLNTAESSPSGNQWGMPLRMVLDAGSVRIEDTVLIGARNLDPPEEVFIRESGLATSVDAIDGVLEGADAVYVAFDADVMNPDELPSFMPEPGGWSVDEAEQVLRSVAERCTVAGAGLTGVTPDPGGIQPLARLVAALGL